MRTFYREIDNYPQYFYSDEINDLLYGEKKTEPSQTQITSAKEKSLTYHIVFLLVGLALLCVFVNLSIYAITSLINGDGETILCVFFFAILLFFSIIDVSFTNEQIQSFSVDLKRKKKKDHETPNIISQEIVANVDPSEDKKNRIKEYLAHREEPVYHDFILPIGHDCCRKGVSEEAFFHKVQEIFPSSIFESEIPIEGIWGNNPDAIVKGQCYYPDIIIKSSGLYINVEIDEPYTGDTHEPIHYAGSDDFRNQYLTSHGWEVIRFTEEQVIKYPDKCIGTIQRFISVILNGGSGVINPFDDEFWIPIWSKETAISMATADYRQTYLIHNEQFGQRCSS